MANLLGNFNPDIEFSNEEDEFSMTDQDFRVREKMAIEAIELGEAALRLYNNPDFEKVVISHYLQKEPARLVGMFATKLPPGEHEMVKNELLSIGTFKNFLSGLVQASALARHDLESLRGYINKYGTVENPVYED